MRTSTVAILTALGVVLTGCQSYFDSLVSDSASNDVNIQVGKVGGAAVVNKDAFTVDMPSYLAKQMAAVEKHVVAKRTALSDSRVKSICEGDSKSPEEMKSAADAMLTAMSVGDALKNDRVVDASVATMLAGLPAYRQAALSWAGSAGNAPLDVSDFQTFHWRVSDAVSSSQHGLPFNHPNNPVPLATNDTLLADVFGETATQDPSSAPLVAYLGAYFHNNFVDRFGNKIQQPSLTSGITDSAISNVVRVLLELGGDNLVVNQVALRDPVLTSADKSKFYPQGNSTAPTFYSIYKSQNITETIVDPANGGDPTKPGVTINESKLIEAGSNLVATQGVTLFGGLLQELASIDIGFVLAPNFAVGSNGTIKAVAETVIETSLRRGAELGLYCIMEKYDLDSLGSVINP